MKFLGKISKIGLLLFFVMSASVLRAQECSKTVDVLCDAFNKMAFQVSQCQTLEGLNQIDFNTVVENSGAEDIPDSCMQYRLTKEDKMRLKASVNKFVDATVDKVYDLAGGIISKEQLNQEMEPTRKQFVKAIDDSVTFEDLTNAFANS